MCPSYFPLQTHHRSNSVRTAETFQQTNCQPKLFKWFDDSPLYLFSFKGKITTCSRFWGEGEVNEMTFFQMIRIICCFESAKTSCNTLFLELWKRRADYWPRDRGPPLLRHFSSSQVSNQMMVEPGPEPPSTLLPTSQSRSLSV